MSQPFFEVRLDRLRALASHLKNVHNAASCVAALSAFSRSTPQPHARSEQTQSTSGLHRSKGNRCSVLVLYSSHHFECTGYPFKNMRNCIIEVSAALQDDCLHRDHCTSCCGLRVCGRHHQLSIPHSAAALGQRERIFEQPRWPLHAHVQAASWRVAPHGAQQHHLQGQGEHKGLERGQGCARRCWCAAQLKLVEAGL